MPTTPASRGLREDGGNPLFHMSGLYELLPITWAMSPEDAAICAESTLVELLRNGSTTAKDRCTRNGLGCPALAKRTSFRPTSAMR